MTQEESPPTTKVSRRRANRIAAMQFVYTLESNSPEDFSEGVRIFFENRDQPRDYYSFAEELVNGVWENLTAVDDVIKENAQNWSFSRIARVDLAILRLAIYELNFRMDIPPIVSINEAIDLGKEFSDKDAKRFINGILDKIKGKLTRPFRTAVDG